MDDQKLGLIIIGVIMIVFAPLAVIALATDVLSVVVEAVCSALR